MLAPALLFTSFAANSMAVGEKTVDGAKLGRFSQTHYNDSDYIAIYEPIKIKKRIEQLGVTRVAPFNSGKKSNYRFGTNNPLALEVSGSKWLFKPKEDKILFLRALGISTLLYNPKTKSVGVFDSTSMEDFEKFLKQPLENVEKASDFKVHVITEDLTEFVASPYSTSPQDSLKERARYDISYTLDKLNSHGYKFPEIITNRFLETNLNNSKTDSGVKIVNEIYYTDDKEFDLNKHLMHYKTSPIDVAIETNTGKAIAGYQMISEKDEIVNFSPLGEYFRRPQKVAQFVAQYIFEL